MSDTKQKKEMTEVTNSLGSSGISRRDFLKYTGAVGASVATMGLISCDDDTVGPDMDPDPGSGMVSLGTGDVGVLNYAYALEQLEAAFYIAAVDGGALSGKELDTFKDIRDHEVAHADFYKTAISSVKPKKIIPGLTPNFSKIDFGNRDVVVQTALTFENLGVAAYNGAGAMLKTPKFLVVAGKIVSVEARHASAISDIALPNTGIAQNKINKKGLDLAYSADQVLKAAGKYIKEDIDASGLPSQSYLN